MTICIAASCWQDKKRKLILCADHKIGNFAAQAEIELKLRWARQGWPAMVAGDLSRAEELITTIRTHLDPITLTRGNVFDEVRRGAQLFRDKLADELVRTKLSVSYQYLRDNKGKFPSPTVYETYTEISKIDSGAELLIAGFINKDAYIFVVEKDCTVSYRKHFAAIGTGAYIAEPALYQRQQSEMESVERTIYKVYEAKRLSEIADGVGKKTTMVLVELPDSSGSVPIKYITEPGIDFFSKKYIECGLKPVPLDMVVKEEFFHEVKPTQKPAPIADET